VPAVTTAASAVCKLPSARSACVVSARTLIVAVSAIFYQFLISFLLYTEKSSPAF
jgi:hypothetical protein